MAHDPLFHINLPQEGKKRRKRSLKNTGITVLILVFIAFIIWIVVLVTRIVSGIQAGADLVKQAGQDAMMLDFAAVEADLHGATEEIERAQSGLLFFSWLRVVPFVRDQVAGVSFLFDAGIRTLGALEDASRVANRLFASVQTATNADGLSNLSLNDRVQLTRAFHVATPDFQKMAAKTTLIARDLQHLGDLSLVAPLRKVLEPVRTAAPDVFDAIDALSPLSAAIFDFTGYGEDRQWLMLFLNNTELRPGGGFIGTYGLLLMRDGEVKAVQVDDSYAVDKRVEGNVAYNEIAPVPITTYTPATRWYFRDANWSPDFAVSAADSMRLFEAEHRAIGSPSPKIHAVVGFTPTFAENVLAVTGPINVDGFTFTPENVTELLEYQVEFGYEELDLPKEDRKDIVGSLTKAVMHEIKTADLYELFSLFRVAVRNVREKQIVFYSTDPQIEAAYQDAGWGGIITSNASDQLMVVDANMLALKTDRVMERNTDYSIKKEGDGYVATVTLHYTHTAPTDKFTSRYRDYVRVYAPLGSELIDHSDVGEIISTEELGMQSFGFFHVVEPETTSEITLEYRLPASVAASVQKGVYQLQVFKQIGASNNPLTLDLDFGKNVRVAEPTEDASQFGDDVYHLNTILSQDSVFTVEL